MTTNYILDCSECVGRERAGCDDCLVKFIVDLDDERPVVLDDETARAVRVLDDAGLVRGARRLRAVS